MKKLNVQKEKLKRYIKKPHLQAFIMSFFIFLALFFIISKTSGSNVGAGMPEDAAADVGLYTPMARARDESIGRRYIPDFIEDIFTEVGAVELDVKSGDTIATLLSALGIGYGEILEVSNAINPTIKTSDIKTGDRIAVRYRPMGDGAKAELISLEIIKSPVYKVKAERTGSGFRMVEERQDITSELVRSEGEITKGSGLIETALSAGVPYNVIDKFYEIFSFDVDFERDIYPGDRFQVMYEQLYSERGEYLGSGDLAFASLYLNSRRVELKLYRYENEKGVSAYYDENGKSASKTLKKTPINGSRISSKYGSRHHPILGYTRDHKGVDFAAPSGTPIPAAGSGVVVFKGWKPGYGNYIKIKHNGTYSTAYGHMSAFKPGVNVGKRVTQGQIVGFVGNTGLSTGPHLHYEIIKDGRHVNPLTIRLPSTQNVAAAEITRFAAARDRIGMQFAVLDRNFSRLAGIINPARPAAAAQ